MAIISPRQRGASWHIGSLCLLQLGIFLGLVPTGYIITYHLSSQAPINDEAHANIPHNMGSMHEKVPPDPQKGKERIIKMLNDAGIVALDNATIDKPPTWSDVVSIYGDRPRIYGLEKCEAFRRLQPDAAERYMGIAGMFNSGTNLMFALLAKNCASPEHVKKYGKKTVLHWQVRWQVPWGKHNPPSNETFRQTHRERPEKSIDPNTILPIATIRDPYQWMRSMCRSSYGASWKRTREHCPNLIPNQDDIAKIQELQANESVPVTVWYSSWKQDYNSLAHLWNEFYSEYTIASFPNIIVRMEDLIFFPKQTTQEVCECVGGRLKSEEFVYVVDNIKNARTGHASANVTLVDAIIRYAYATDKDRLKGFEVNDLAFANKTLNRELMEFFGYPSPRA